MTKSHMQRFIELYKDSGIELKADPCSERETQKYTNRAYSITFGDHDENPLLQIGYGGFFTVVYFDKDENFIHQGFWE